MKKAIPLQLAFSAYFFFICGSFGVINGYLPVFFNSFGYSNTQVGVLTSVGSFAALLGLPLWGSAVDRARYKNNALYVISMLVCVFCLMFLAGTSFAYIFAVSALFMGCNYPLSPIGTSMGLECAASGQISYGPARFFGSVGLIVLPLLSGLCIDRWGIRTLFPLYAAIIGISIVTALALPKTRGRQTAAQRVNMFSLFKDKELTGLCGFLLVSYGALGYFFSFFPVYMDNLGMGDMIGINTALQYIPEGLFILFMQRLIDRLGYFKLFTGAFLFLALRLLLIGTVAHPLAFMAANVIGGLGTAMTFITMTVYLRRVPQELAASAQMLNMMLAHSISRFLGSLLGGIFSDAYGIPAVFVAMSAITFALALLFVLWARKTNAFRQTA